MKHPLGDSMFLKNAWYVAAWDTEVTKDKPLARQILGEDVVLYRGADGKAVAMVDRCCHRLAPLSMGRIEGSNLRCMYHGLLFAPDGRCVEMPQDKSVPASMKVKTFPLVERHKFLWIWMGDPALADPTSMPDAHWQDDPGWRSIPSYVYYEHASYLLIMDNLLDFSHLGYVHENTLGGGRSSAEVVPKLDYFDWGVRITRWYYKDAMPPFLKNVAKYPGPIDRWQIYDWHLKGNFLSMDTGNAPAGTGAPEGKIVPEAMRFHSCQAVTPETATSCHYFWTYGHGFDLDNHALTQEVSSWIARGFQEDKDMIQAQQSVIDRHPEEALRCLKFDAAVNRARLNLSKLLEAERQAEAAAAASRKQAQPQPAVQPSQV